LICNHFVQEFTMTATRTLLATATLAAASLLSAGAAFAQEATPDTWMQASATSLSRAAVQADAVAARNSNFAQAWTQGYIAPVMSTTPRAEVRAQTLQAIQRGEVKAINAEAFSLLPGAALVSQAG